MLSLLNVLAGKKNLNAVLKGAVFFAFFSFFSFGVFGQCNNLNVSVGSDIEACNGANITLTATYTGGPSSGTPIYQWSFNNNGGAGGAVDIPGAISNTYLVTNFDNSEDGTYTCTVTFPNEINCYASNSLNLDFPNNNNFSLNAGNDIIICQGALTNINSSVSDVPAGGTVTYSWTSNPAGLSSTNASPSLSGLSAGTYTITGTITANGCSDNDQVNVTVTNLNLNAGNDQTICQGSAFNISSTISNQPSSPAVTYSWTAVNATTGSSVTLTQTGTPSNPTFNNLPAGTYTFTGTATVSGCTDTDQIQVIVNPNPTTPTFTIPANGCPGVSIPISGFTPLANTTYSWYPNVGAFINGSTSNPSVTFNNGGNYNVYVTATNSNGCSSNSAIQNVAITNLQVLNPFVEFGTAALSANNYNNITTYTICSGVSGSSAAYIYNTFPNGSSATYSYSIGTQPSLPILLGIAEEIGLNIGNNYFTITGALNGCVVSETFNIYAGSNPYVAGGVSNSVGLCTGQTVNFAISPVNPTTNSPNAAGTTYSIGVSDVSSSLPGAVNSVPYATYTDLTGNQNVSYTFNSSSCGQNPPGYPANTFYAVIQASNACGTTTSTVSPIVVSALPTSNFNVSATTICVNSSVTITNAGTSGNAITGPNNNAPFSCLNTGGFYYTISPATGWTVSGGSIGASGIPVNNWNGINGITAASNPATVSFNTPGTYIITQKYQNGCGTSTTQKTICVVAPPTCAFTVNPTSSCTPLITAVTNNTTGPSCGNTPLALTYQWTVANPANGTSSINTTASSVNPTITLNNNTVAPNLAVLTFPITVLVNPLIPGTTNPVPNCSSTCNQTVTVCPQPSFIAQPVQPATVCLDGTFNALSVTVSYLCPGSPSYQWYSNINPTSSGGILISGETSASYVPPATAVGTIYYYCVVTFPNNTNCTQIISINVPAIVVPDPVATATPATQTICVGGTVPNPLTGAYTNGVGTPSYQWNLVGAPTPAISGATLSTYTPPAFSSTGTFNYTVTINTSGSGCNASTSAPIEVIVIPDPTITTQPIGNTYCQNTPSGNITNLSVSATGGSGTFSYQWFVNTTNSNTGGAAIPGATSASFSPPSSTVGTFYYYCEISQPVTNCSVTSNPAEIIIVASPTFTAQPLNAQTLCNGGTTTPLSVVTAGGTGNITYQWYSNTTSSYVGGTLIFGATQSSYTPPNTNATLPNTTYYYCIVSYSAGGCSSITSNISAINIYPALIISTQPLNAETICIGGTSSNLIVSILAGTGTGNYSYQWYSNSSASNSGGTAISGATSATLPSQVFNNVGAYYFYCLITDSGNGCGSIASAVATVTVVNDPTISVQPLPTQSICQNAAPIVLEITANGGNGALQYQWYSNTGNSNSGGIAIIGATSPNYTPSSINIGTYYYYCVITTPTSGCSVSSAVGSVIVISGPTFTTQPLSSVVCQGGSVQQMCVTFINGTGTPQYQWYSNSSASTSGGVPIPNANSNCYTPASNIVGTTYYYCLINLIGGGCSSIISNISSVIVNPIPVAQPIADLTFCNQGQTSVVVLNSNEQNTTFQWSISNPSIGVPMQNGTSNSIPSFIATNSSTSIISSQVNYTPVYTSNGVSCSGTSSSFNIFVNPTPLMSLFNPELFVFCEASQGFVAFSSNIPSNISYNYTNDNNLIGVPLSGTISSPSNGLSFLAVNNSNQPLTSNFLVSPVFTNNNQSCPGNTVYFAITVNPLPDIIPISSQTVCATETASNLYSSINPIIGPGTNYVWTNTNPAIGMASTGVGSNYFTSTNTTLFPISGTISVAPTYTNNGVTCQGSSISFDLIVNPMPTINPISNQTLCLGDLTNTIDPSGPIPNTIFNWTNNNNSIGLGASGAGIINSFLGLNSTNQANSATISYTPAYTNNNVTCSGQSIQVGIVVNPVPILQGISNIEICAQSNVSVPFLTTNNVSNTVFQWTNSNSQIGLPLNGEGPISFYAQNSTSSPMSATISVTALYVQSGDTCVGSIEVFTIVILPTPTINPISNQTICANNLSNAISFQANYSGVIFNWSNTNSNIGLGTSGNGNIAPFTGTNNGTNPIQGLLTVTPSLTTNSQVCSGTPVNATVTINPLPLINTIPNTTYCEGEFINVVFSSNISSSVTYDWTNSNSSNGIGSSGNENINFTGSNNNLVNETSSFEVTPIFNFNGIYCPGNSTTFNIEIIPTPTINPLSDITICNGSPVDEILFSSPYTTADFNWTNSIPTIGIAATGVGNIPDFNAINNSTTNPIVSSVFVTPFISQSNLTCAGIPENFNITILPSTTINPISNQLYCNQEFTQFIPITGTGNSFSWSNDNINIGLGNTGTGGINSFQIINNSNQINQSNITVFSGYTLNGVSCPGNTTSFSISVLPTPTSNVTSDITICNGITVPEIIFSGNATTFNWLNSNSTIGLPNSGSGNIASFVATNYTPNAIASIVTYTPVITSNNFSCFGASNSFTINVQASPIFVIQPIPTQSACLNGTITTLTVQYSNGNGTPSYQWYSNSNSSYSNGIAIQGETTSSFTPSSLQSGTTYYYCMISFSGAGGCTMINSNIAEVIVVPDPTISVQPLTTQTICVGGTIPLALNVNFTGGVGTPTYQWFSTPASSISGGTSNSYTPPVYSTTGTFNYYATISLSGSGCDALTSANATVIVVADPLVSVQPTATQSVCQNTATLQLSVSITGGNGSASYQWFSNTTNSNIGGTIIAGATLSAFTPPSSVVGIQYYYCVINQTGANCGVTSNPAEVIVNLAPAISSQPLGAQQHCLNAVTNNLQVDYSNGTGLPSYQWFVHTTNSAVGGAQINSATNNLFTPPSSIDGTFYYYCVISFVSGGGCPSVTSNVSQVIIHPYPIVTVTGGEIICLLESADINFAFTPSSGLYDITLTSNGQSSILENYNGANPVYTVTPTLTTTFVVTNIAYDQVPQCAIQPNTSIVVTVNPLPALNNSTYTYCSDVTSTTLQYIPDANTYSYDWLPNPSANYIGQNNGPSSITVSLPDPLSNSPTNFYYVSNLTNNATGCQALDSILVTINPNPVGIFTLPTTGCINSPIPLSNGNATIGSYEWNIDGLLYSTLANPIPPVFNSLGIHDIEMVASNIYGCTDTLFSSIQIYDQAVSNFITDLNSGCAPLPVNFTNLSTGSYITSYDWTFAPDTVSWNNVFSSTSLIDPPSVTYLQGDITTTYNVTLAVTNACGTVSSSQTITVLPTPVANFTLATHTICSGSTLMVNNISVGEPTGYVWNYGPFTSYNPNLNSMFFPSDSVTNVYPITLTITNACGTDVYNDSITVLPDNVNGGFTTSLDAGCSPLTVTLVNTTFNTNLTAIWHLDDPLNTTISNQNTVQFTYFATNNITQYYNPYLVVTDGCANDTIYANLSVFANPIPNITASQLNICEGSTVDFSGNVIGGGNGFGYLWDFGGLGTANTQSASFNFADGSAMGQNIPVTLTVSSPNNFGTNCSNSTSTVIYVFDNPVLSQVTYNTTNGCSLLDVQVSNLPNNLNLINWGDGSTNTNAGHTYVNNSSAIQSYNLGISSSVTYPTIPNLVCTSLANQSISVHPSPLPVIASSATQSCEGQMIDFTASTINNQNFGVDFSWNIGNLSTSNTSNTSYNFITGSVAGIAYPIELTASQTTLGLTCSETVNSTVVIYETPDVTPITFNTNSGCSDLEIIIANLPAANNQINWGDGVANFSNSHTYNNNGSGLLNYPITLTSTSTYGIAPQLNCVATSTQNITVYPTPLPQIFSSAINVCEGGSVDFIASTSNNQNTGITYLWDFGVLGTSSSANTSTTFTTGNATGLQTTVSLTAFQNTSGTICTTTTSEIVNVFDTPDLTAALYSNVNDCSPLLVSISNLPTSTYTYNWGDGTTTSNPNHIYLNQGATPLNYNISIDATTFYPTLPMLTCNAITNQIVQVNPQPFASFSINPSEGCFYNPVTTTLENTSVNAIAPYVWNYDGIAHTTNSLNYIATFNTPGAHPVELVVTNQFGCTDSTSQDFIIHDLPTVTLNTIDDALCLGATTEFEIDGTGISTSSWDFGDGITLNLLNPTSLVHYYNQPGVYSVTAIVTNIYGCSDTITFPNEVIIYPRPTASFTTNTTIADIVYPYFEFYDNSAGAINYYWNFGDSNWSNDVNPTHTYNTEGNYLVELTVTNEYNCFDIAYQIVQVEGIVVYIPNAFTPLDYNGVNDVFKPTFSSTEGIEFYEMIIYNRWGAKIFQTNSIDEAWIGNSQENDPGDDNYYAQNDTYIYTVRYRKKARAYDPQPDQIITGHVTIIR